MTNLDEYDNLTAPFLMSHGLDFYSQQFNMHFPLPYYLANLFSPLWIDASFSRAIAIFRLSLLIVYITSFIAVFISYKNRKSKYAFSFWIFLLSLVLSLYQGNLYLSDTFSTIFITSIFWLVLPLITKWEKFSNYHLFLLIALCSLSIWNQPLLIILFIIPLFFLSRSQIKLFIFTSIIINIVPVFFLCLGGQLPDFIDQTIIFNSQVYSNFYPEQTGNHSILIQNFFDFIPHQIALFSKIDSPFLLFQLISHFSILLLILFLLFKKHYKYIMVLIFIIVASRIREIKINPGQLFNNSFFPFIAIASSSLFILLFSLKSKLFKIFISITIVILFILAASSFTPIFKQSLNHGYNYEVFWSYRQRIGQIISILTLPGEKILIYPYDSDLYYFSRRLPVDKFIYWYPWIDSVSKYRKTRLDTLSSNPPVVIYYHNLGYKDQPEYYASLFPNLLDGYTRVSYNNQETDIWLNNSYLDRISQL
jgi:hypothetical protein